MKNLISWKYVKKTWPTVSFEADVDSNISTHISLMVVDKGYGLTVCEEDDIHSNTSDGICLMAVRQYLWQQLSLMDETHIYCNTSPHISLMVESKNLWGLLSLMKLKKTAAFQHNLFEKRHENRLYLQLSLLKVTQTVIF